MKQILRISLIILFLTSPLMASHTLEYRWESPSVTMVYRDTVGTPVPTSYGFWANMADLGHKFRLAQAFMADEDRGLIGNRLSIEVSVFALGIEPPRMELIGERSRATIQPPYTDEKFAYALYRAANFRMTEIGEEMPARGEASALGLLTRYPDEGFAVFSPDGRHVAFRSWREESVDVYVAHSDFTEVTRLGATSNTRLPPLAYAHSVMGFPSWSPDGTSIAYIADGRVAVAGLRGRARILQGTESAVSAFEWSPNGKTITALISAQEDNIEVVSDVVLLDPSGNSPAVSLGDGLSLLRAGFFAADMRWSPDSQTLAIALNLARGIRLTPEDIPEAGAVIYLVDAATRAARAVEVESRVVDLEWDGDTLMVVVRDARTSEAVAISPNLEKRVVFTDSEGVMVLGSAGGRASVLSGDAVHIVDLRTGKTEESAAGMKTVTLPAGKFGGYRGAKAEIVTENEPSNEVALILDPGGSLPGLREGTFRKASRTVMVDHGRTLQHGWLSEALSERQAVAADWSPQAGSLAVTSARRGIHELQLVKTAGSVGLGFTRAGLYFLLIGFVGLAGLTVYLFLRASQRRTSRRSAEA